MNDRPDLLGCCSVGGGGGPQLSCPPSYPERDHRERCTICGQWVCGPQHVCKEPQPRGVAAIGMFADWLSNMLAAERLAGIAEGRRLEREARDAEEGIVTFEIAACSRPQVRLNP